MRQAGRYHSHYQNLKKSYTFEELCKTPKLAAETAMGPMEEFDFDVAILFSDILVVLQAMNIPVIMNWFTGKVSKNSLPIKMQSRRLNFKVCNDRSGLRTTSRR